MTDTTIAQRLHQLRDYMKKAGVTHCYVPSSDPHQNEYVPAHWQRRCWISGFSGSAGDVLIDLENAYLCTDPRYFLQAEQQLDPSCYQLIKGTQSSSQPLYEHLLAEKPGFSLGLDPRLVNLEQQRQFQRIADAKNATLHYLNENPIDAIWQHRPHPSTASISIYDPVHAGCSAADKIAQVRAIIEEYDAQSLVINDLSSIAWLLNLRGDDILYNPLIISNVVLTKNEVYFFTDENKISPELEQYLQDCGVRGCFYSEFPRILSQLTGNVWLDPRSCNVWIKQQMTDATSYEKVCPIPALKAVKNTTEIKGMKRAHVLDALALVNFLYWLDNNWHNGVSELSAANQLNSLRRANPHCVGLSFTTISGFAANGAVIHYSVDEKTNLTINDSSLYLVDSGGQYLEGTTDVTRTVHLGTPTEAQKKHYTLVLKGHLALRHAVFPRGTCGEHLNALAHLPLWKNYLDYGHGTGHGVGCYSCVHESPPRISAAASNAPLLPGMIVSNEPGVYFDNNYGIRIENLCLVTLVADQQQSVTGHGPFYGFEDLTLVPYCRQLINKALLTQQEIDAINSYHTLIYSVLAPEIDKDTLKNWLKQATKAL